MKFFPTVLCLIVILFLTEAKPVDNDEAPSASAANTYTKNQQLDSTAGDILDVAEQRRFRIPYRRLVKDTFEFPALP